MASDDKLVTIIESGPRRMRASRGEAVVITTDDKGRMEFQPLDIDLARKALEDHYKRRTH